MEYQGYLIICNVYHLALLNFDCCIGYSQNYYIYKDDNLFKNENYEP